MSGSMSVRPASAATGDLPGLSVTPGSWALGLAIMLGIGLLVGLPPALRAMRLRIVDALADR
jgi:putative ABC transport system permease protein